MEDQNDNVERQTMKQYWTEHSAEPTVQTMMLDSKAEEIDKLERPEVLSLLGSVQGLHVVELGAGIGRFTGELAKQAKSMVALDFMAVSIEENRRVNGHFGSIDFRVGDATELQLEPASADVVFSNWLLMYLNDTEVSNLAKNTLGWLKEGGHVFFRESCFRQSGDKSRKGNPSHYRNPRDYFRMFDEVEAQLPDGRHAYFELCFCKCIDTYVKVKRNQGQICWKWVKVISDRPRSSTFRHFLDDHQYTTQNIKRYEYVYGSGFFSCGGLESTKDLSQLLNITPNQGQRVLDVGCGTGGSTYYISETHACHVHGLDLSVNAVLLALERAAERTGDVTFEVADVMTREYPEGSFDVVYSRDCLIHIKDQPAVLRRLFQWLAPGGRLLLTDYCCSAASPSDHFQAYLSQRGYSLHTVEDYAKMLEEAGFCDVKAEDRTGQFEGYLVDELKRFREKKDAFLAEGFSEGDYDWVTHCWQDKISRARAGEQRWGLFTASKPK